jgi:hypothetical protein
MKTFKQLMMTQSGGTLDRLQQQSQMLKQIEKTFITLLPTPLNQYCYVANVRENTLVVYTKSALWATQLRYLTPELVNQCCLIPLLSKINRIEVKIRF